MFFHNMRYDDGKDNLFYYEYEAMKKMWEETG